MDLVKRYICEQVANKKLSIDKAKKMLQDIGKEKNFDNEKDIAIIGMSGRFPKSRDLREFWDNLLNKVNCIDIPSKKRSSVFEGIIKEHFGFEEIREEMYELGGYIDEVDKFDAKFFGISSKEAKYMDPWQKLILEIVYLAIEDSGMANSSMSNTNVGVYIGRDHSCESSYAKLFEVTHPLVLTGSYTSILSSRISYALNLKGPSLVIDTACSSALVAIHNACFALRSGQSEVAIAGGINIKENLIKLDSNPMDRILSEEGIVRTFDKKAKGTLLGEGAGAIVLKPLSKALKDGNNIYAVIKGSAVNNEGTSKRIATPSAESQKEVIIKAWEDAGISPETISYIEAHGTGTLLGDPIEIKAIQGAFREYTDRKQFCAIGTVKTNIGHTVAASGMASVIKAVLSLKNKKIIGNINFEEVNPYIDFIDSPVYINDKLSVWNVDASKRRCGVNSFGFSGTNCHIILEEPPQINGIGEEALAEEINEMHIFIISARTNKALKELIKSYKYYLEENKYNFINIRDLCYTTMCGRGHYEERIILFIKNIDDLYKKICRLNSNVTFDDLFSNDIYYGRHKIVKSYKENRRLWELTEKDVAKLCEEADEKLKSFKDNNVKNMIEICKLYVKGANFDWRRLIDINNRKIISIPLYPLERIRHWVDNNDIKIVKKTKIENKNKLEKKKRNIEIKGRENNNYSETEKYIGRLWAEILQINKINIMDNFYTLGGDSMKAIKIVSLINRERKINVDAIELMKYTSVEEFSKYLDNNYFNKNEVNDIFSNIQCVEKDEYYPISSAQKRMFILNQIDSNSTNYNMPKAILIKGDLDIQRCKEVFRKIVKRHEALRTSFHIIDGMIMQKVHDDIVFDVENIFIEGGDISEAINSFIRPFNLETAPLLRVGLSNMSDESTLILFDVHHIISDGTSMELFVKEFIYLYKGIAVPKQKIQYKDFAVWQNRLFETDIIKDQENYWVKKFNGEIPILNLQTDFPRPSVQSFKGEKVTFNTSKELKKNLQDICLKTETTMYMVLLASYNIFLYKYTGQEDFIVGSPIAGRRHPGIDNIIGMFVNTLPMRNTPKASKTVYEFLNEVKSNSLEAYENQDYQFEELVNKLGIKRDYSRNPIFDTMFNLHNKDMSWKEVDDLKFEHIEIDNHVSKFDLTLNAIIKENCIDFEFEYSTDLFMKETIERMAQHFINILKEISTNLNKKLSDIEVMTYEEKQNIIYGFNDTKEDYIIDENICHIFRNQVQDTPDAIAIIYNGQLFSYSELDKKSDILAINLKKNGVSKGDPIGLMVSRSCDMVIGILGILKCGGIYLPLDPSYPDKRTQFMITDSNINFIIAQKNYLERLKSYNIKTLCIEEICDNKVEEYIEYEDITYEDSAYIIYTSGSTGLPKGVEATHAGIMNRLIWMWKNYPYTPNEVCCQKTSMNFVDSICEILSPLLKGVPLLIIPDEVLKDPSEFINILNEYKVTRITLVPSLLKILLETRRDLDKYLSDLKICICSGEVISVNTVKRFREVLPQCKLLNLYGSSEVSADATCYEVNSYDSFSWCVPIGKPISNMQVYILDTQMNLVPVGVCGEIFIGGIGLAKGYWEREDLTNERFIWNEIDEKRVCRLYASGDMGRYRKDGTIEYLGRKDHQVKIRGYRIEIEEVEALIKTCNGVRDAVVFSFQDASSNMQLGAYLDFNDDVEGEIDSIKEKLKLRLPAYMIPTYFSICKDIPLLPNGKIDRSILTEIELLKNKKMNEYIQPKTPVEVKLIEIWTQLTGFENVEVHDDLFNVGGNSLTAMQLIIRISENFGVELTMKDLITNARIKEIASKVEEAIIANSSNSEIDSMLDLLENMDIE